MTTIEKVVPPQRQRAPLTALLTLSAILTPTVALAHAPVPGVGAFWNGALHPLLVPSHLLALIAAGILIGQHAPTISRWTWPALVAALAAGLVIPSAASVGQVALIGTAAAAGVLLALNRAWLDAILLAVVAIGVFVSLDSAVDDVLPQRTVAATLGVLTGATLIATMAGGLAAAAVQPWQRIALRASGSWIAAASIMVLALEFAPREAVP